MNKFEQTYKEIISEVRYRSPKNNHFNGSIPTFDYGTLYEDCAFHKLPRKFTNQLIDIIKSKF